jgi:hypothetical protein
MITATPYKWILMSCLCLVLSYVSCSMIYECLMLDQNIWYRWHAWKLNMDWLMSVAELFLEPISCVDFWLPKFLALTVMFNSQMVLCSELCFLYSFVCRL